MIIDLTFSPSSLRRRDFSESSEDGEKVRSIRLIGRDSRPLASPDIEGDDLFHSDIFSDQHFASIPEPDDEHPHIRPHGSERGETVSHSRRRPRTTTPFPSRRRRVGPDYKARFTAIETAVQGISINRGTRDLILQKENSQAIAEDARRKILSGDLEELADVEKFLIGLVIHNESQAGSSWRALGPQLQFERLMERLEEIQTYGY